MKKRRHWKKGNILTVLYGTAELLLKTKCISEWFVLWLLMHEAHVRICIIINPKHVFAFVILKATGIDRL